MVSGDTRFLSAARAIARRLARSAIRHDGRCTWIAEAGGRAATLDGSFAAGTAGIAWFLAHVGEHRAAREALRHSVGRNACPVWAQPAFGRLLGILEAPGGALTASEAPPGIRLADAASLSEAVLRHAWLGDAAALADAEAAVRRLVAWVEAREERLPRHEVGLADGASGVGLALCAWAARVKGSSLAPEALAAGRRALWLERAWFNPVHGWHGTAPPCRLAIARLGCQALAPALALLADAGAAIDWLRRSPRLPDPNDASWSRGSAGILAALLAAFETTGDDRHREAAQNLGDSMLRAAAHAGWRTGDGGVRPGLSNGLAGIGLTLLQLHDPDGSCLPLHALWRTAKPPA